MKYKEKINTETKIIRKYQKILKEGKTKYQKYQIYKTKEYGKIVIIEGDIQSTQKSEKQYHEMLVQPAMFLHSNPETILIMGGGEGATLREVLKHKSVKKIVMIDIDKEFVKICKKYLPTFHKKSFENKKVEIYYEDINKYIERTQEKFDVIIGDLVDISYDENNKIYKSFYNKKFYLKLKKILNPNYIIATQAGDLTKYQVHKNIKRNMKKVYKNIKSYGEFIPDFYTYWGYIIITDKKIDIKNGIEKNYKKKKIPLNKLNKKDMKRLFNIPKFLKKS